MPTGRDIEDGTTKSSTDYGLESISATLDSCRKLWIMFPPTNRNLELMKVERGQNAKLARIGNQMEGGIFFESTSEDAVYIPAGCIHAVLTLAGGFLVSLDFATRDTIVPFGNYLAKCLHHALDEHSQRTCLFAFIHCTEVSLCNGRVQEAVDCWLALEDLLRDTANDDRSWLQTAKTCWKGCLDLPEGLNCPCGSEPRLTSFTEHFLNVHLRYLSRP